MTVNVPPLAMNSAELDTATVPTFAFAGVLNVTSKSARQGLAVDARPAAAPKARIIIDRSFITWLVSRVRPVIFDRTESTDRAARGRRAARAWPVGTGRSDLSGGTARLGGESRRLRLCTGPGDVPEARSKKSTKC